MAQKIDQIYKSVKIMRKKANLTQKELARKIGKSESTIQKYEAGKVEIPLSVLETMSDTCGYIVTVIVREEESAKWNHNKLKS